MPELDVKKCYTRQRDWLPEEIANPVISVNTYQAGRSLTQMDATPL